ncbi:hypothetical protein ACX3VT_06865 [Aerococcus sanguinicola]|uniref:hypothetical protein n=1 Tax=Aerococcus sp. UMB10185 TaxID=3046357 RepID=UPI0008A4495E|nr:hypothetical protein [Aerococcus sp. UMB10185]KAB0646629.1 hypothetical protein F6I01_06260 [Aerococcus sanguinicola]MDK6233953.1 hypothetical protein [Aerococcus sp. UMB10185]OFN04171.1 hypothetical protein HMPREF2626_04535 [Aerococcus sp. HMSC062A02]OHO45847.1 hypothetical protein HMPREF2705_03825 [Aerococcus sp. HMSC035B07]
MKRIEKIMNGYVFILVCMIYFLGRLLDFALGQSLSEVVWSFENFMYLLGLATYLFCLIKMKRDGVIDSIW